jgi:hypothetical protein
LVSPAPGSQVHEKNRRNGLRLFILGDDGARTPWHTLRRRARNMVVSEKRGAALGPGNRNSPRTVLADSGIIGDGKRHNESPNASVEGGREQGSAMLSRQVVQVL